MRVVSLLPSATEIVYFLGLDDLLVGVTAECDHPPAARAKPSVSSPVVPSGTAEEIDRAVRERVAAGLPLYDLDTDLVRSLRPDLVLAQDLCRVCAVPSGDVAAALERLGVACDVLSLDPPDLAGVLDSLADVAAAAGRPGAADEPLARLIARIEAVAAIVAGRPPRRVACLEWAAPPFVAGHWVPEMVAAAGGTDVLGAVGSPSLQSTWEDVVQAAADVVVFMPCGYDLAGAVAEAPAVLDHLLCEAGPPEIWAVDATSYFSRPGPRLVDGVELLAAVLHPGTMAEPPAGRAERLA
jgi:iron complex transport system substrate-binding protein